MPLYPPNEFPDLYEQILKGALTRDSFVLIFAAADVDAICAARIIATLLEQDHVRTTLIPVSGYTDLATANETHVKDRAELRSIITINCGGMVDLTEFFSLPSEKTKVFVLDSHRPLNLQNIFGANQIHVFSEEGNTEELQTTKAAFEALEYDGSSDDDDDDDDDSDASDSSRDSDSDRGGDDEDDARSKRGSRKSRSRSGSRAASDRSRSTSGSRSRSRSRDNGDGDDDEKENGDGQGSDRGSKRRRSSSNDGSDKSDRSRSRSKSRSRSRSPTRKRQRTSKKDKRQQRRDHRRAIAEYYATGTSYSKSAAGLAYQLCLKLGRERSEALWMAIVSLSYQYAHNLISLRQYYMEIKDLYKPEVLKFSAGLIGQAAVDENSQPDGQVGPGTVLDGKSSGVYYVEDEFQFTLFRHWNLFDSMQHSDYVCTKLGLWRDKGRKRMQSMLAEMGLPLEQCRQPHGEMSKRMRDEIPEKFFADEANIANKYDLQDLRFPSFLRRYGVRGYRGVLSALDMVFALDALLDGGEGWARRDADGAVVVDETVLGGVPDGQGHSSVRGESRSYRDIQVQHTAITSGQRTGVAAITRRKDGALGVFMDDREALPADMQWRRNWYAAYDGLENIDHLLFGIHLAKHLQSAVLRCATTILDKGGIKLFRRFRLVKIDTGSATSIGRIMPRDCALLSRSSPWLNRVATIFLKAFKEFSNKSDLPLVLAAMNPTGETYLVAGYPPVGSRSASHKNNFGLAFQDVCQKTGARARHDAFDTHFMEVKAEDFRLVIDELQRVEF